MCMWACACARLVEIEHAIAARAAREAGAALALAPPAVCSEAGAAICEGGPRLGGDIGHCRVVAGAGPGGVLQDAVRPA